MLFKLQKTNKKFGASLYQIHRIEINRKATRVGTLEVCVSTHVSLRMFIMQVLASQLPFLANRNAELAVPPLFWPDNCIKIGGHVALLSGPTVYTLYCDQIYRTDTGNDFSLYFAYELLMRFRTVFQNVGRAQLSCGLFND